ncbi:hypothetical protein RZR10_15170 [Enterobacter asburiae]|uniref:hypothetical protein n=1 Tax=Enterobacter asburiae TaxID=61645 RepID=UPI00292B5211|nr:hypothetical protein [Enterobacter asburiae]MDV1795065.1 hypothetical protein [Enterobacter asburiae]
MSNIDKHAVQTVADLKAGYTLGHADVAILNELARIALASLEAEPVAWLLSGGGAKNHVSFDSGNAYADPLREVTPLYAAPQLPHPAPEHLAAVATLESKGYTWHGGQLWKPPLGKAPAYITDEQPAVPETLPCPVMLEPGLRFGKGVRTQTMLDALQRRDEYYADLEAMTPGQRADHDAGMKEFAAMLQGAEQQNRQQNIPENIPATQFKPVADLYGLTSPTGSETSFTFDAVEARDFIDGGWSCQEYVELERFQEAITNHTEDKLAMVDHSGDSNNMVEPVTTAYKLPPHIFRELVNRLRDTAVKYQGCQQLREQLSRTLQEVIQPAAPQQEVT